MRILIAATFALPIVLSASVASCQTNDATTVQLPTFRFFTVQTAVSVPDSGGAYLGGINRGYRSSTSRGIPLMGSTPWIAPLARSRGISTGTDAGGVSVHATIVDHEELDRAVLAEAAARLSPPSDTDRRAGELSRRADDGGAAPLLSVAEIRRQQAAEDQDKAEKAAELFAKGRAMEQEGKPAQAKVYYRLAARHASADLKQEIAGRLAKLK